MASAAVRPSNRRFTWDTRLQQREKFTTCIRNNVREYGGGSTCLKELLANADDAKATRFTICLDKSQYSTDCLLGVGMKDLQGPAPWVCNDASFSNQDYHNYTRSVGDSAKADDIGTVGKFGKGALTVYSLTDVIQILSADNLLVLNPHATHLPDQIPSVFGNLVDRRDEHFVDVAADSPNQLEPFLSFTKHCSSVPTLSIGNHYPETLFRLALRTPAAAQHSEISQESLSPDQMAQILQDFVRVAPDLLLFTRHVKSISVFVKVSKDSQCTLMHECTASVSTSTSTILSCKLQKAAITIKDESGCKSKHMWHKATHSISGQSGDVAILELVQEGAAEDGKLLPPVAGKVCSTMALPLAPTSLPVHMNGDFRMFSDRRTLWAGEGDRGQGAKNKSVLVDHIAPAYAAAIASACPSKGPAEEMYKKWPTAYSFQPRLLDSVTSATVEQLIANRCKVLWAPTADMASQASMRVCTSGSGTWVAPSEACLVQPSDCAASAVIINVARRAGLHIPDVPSHVFQALTASSVSMTLFGPDMLRDALLAAGNIVKPSEVSEVLSYVTEDGKYHKLNGLHLILLSDGSVQQIERDRSGGSKFFVFTDAKSKSIYSLMEGNKHQLVEPSPAWEALSKAKVQGGPLLGSKQLNVMVPKIDDLGPSLPKSWRHSLCDIGSQSSQPSPDWVKRFWALMASLPDAVPESLHSFALVPITGDRLASIQHCIQCQALIQAHLHRMPSYAASTLSSIGCVCIKERRADRVSPNTRSRPGSEPLTRALEATSDCLGVPLQQLLSKQRLGSTDFSNARTLLADHVQCSSEEVWSTIRQCPIFEDSNGHMVALGGSKSYGLLPAASWEEHIVELDQLLPWTPIKYHTASATQRKLVKKQPVKHHSTSATHRRPVKKHAETGTHVPSLTDFLQSELLPALMRNPHQHSSSEPLLLQALDELAGHPIRTRLASLTSIFIDGNLHPISKTVDSSSSLLQTLFSTPSTGDDYRMLPQCYSIPARHAVLKRHGLAHLNTPDPNLFIKCSERFSGMGSSLTRDEKRTLSRGLADMLHGNVDAYQKASRSDTAQIAFCPIFKSAELQFPYKSAQPAAEFVALASSADHEHYQLVSLAVPVTDNSHGDTQKLRSTLGLPVQPKRQHVVDHLLKVAADSDLKAALKLGSPLRDFVLAGIQQAYQFIICSVSEVLAEGGSLGITEMADDTGRLRQGAWVLVQDCKFVRPCELCFDLEADTPEGYEVPRMLMTLINAHPQAKRWFIDELKVTALHDGAPGVKQLHENPVTTSVAKYLEGDFNNPAAYPDAVISIDGQEILVHKHVVAKACEVLGRRWDPLGWGSASHPIPIDTSLCCDFCNIHPSYATAVLFLQYFYTGEVKWPCHADVQTASELLVMASMYDVQHLVCIAEMALQCLLDTDNCCAIFAIADHHEAVQLRAQCLHIIRQGHRLIRSSEQYKGLDHTLRAEVELGASHMDSA